MAADPRGGRARWPLPPLRPAAASCAVNRGGEHAQAQPWACTSGERKAARVRARRKAAGGARRGVAGWRPGELRRGTQGKKIAVRKRRGIIVFSPVPFNGSVREINGNGMEGMENYK